MATAPVTFPYTYEVVIKGLVTGDTGVKDVSNILHYRGVVATIPQPATNTNLAGFLAQLKAQLATIWGAAFPNGYSVTEVSGRWMEDSTTAAVLEGTPSAYNGSGGAGDFGPTTESWYIEKRSGFRGKSFRGGVKLSPILESNTDDFQLTTAFHGGPLSTWRTHFLMTLTGPTSMALTPRHRPSSARSTLPSFRLERASLRESPSHRQECERRWAR